MSYRGDQEALRARLEATEQRLRIAEDELADAKRRVAAEVAVEPTRLAPASFRPPPTGPVTRLEAIADTAEHWVRGMVGAGILVMVTYVGVSLDAFSPLFLVALAVLFGFGGPGVVALWLKRTATLSDRDVRSRNASVMAGLLGGSIVVLLVVALALWLRPEIEALAAVVLTVTLALFFSLPTAIYFARRRPRRPPWLDVEAEASVARVAPRARVATEAEAGVGGETDDGDEASTLAAEGPAEAMRLHTPRGHSK